MRTDTVAPKTSALCQPKDIFWDLGLAAIQMANKEMRKEAKSVSMWAASVAMAKELLNTPPTISAIMKRRHSPAAVMSFRRALKVKKKLTSRSSDAKQPFNIALVLVMKFCQILEHPLGMSCNIGLLGRICLDHWPNKENLRGRKSIEICIFNLFLWAGCKNSVISSQSKARKRSF